MQVETANAPARAVHDGHTYHFCADRCRERFEAKPTKFIGAAPTEASGSAVAIDLTSRPENDRPPIA